MENVFKQESSSEGKGARTREALLDAALLAFRERGYEATSVDDILKATGFTKGAFYFHFASKEDFGLAVIDRAREQEWPKLKAALKVDNPDDTFQPIHELFRLFTTHCKSGCIFGNLAAEMGARSPAIQARLAQLFASLTEAVAEMVDALKQRGAVGAAQDSASLARLVVAQLQGAVLLTKLDPDPDLIRRHADALVQMLACTVAAQAPAKRS